MTGITQTLSRAMSANPDGYLTSFKGTRRTYREVVDRVSRLAAGLLDLGLRNGDRVAILALNSDCYLEALYGVPWSGAVAVPLNYRLSPDELCDIMNDAGVSIMICDSVGGELLARVTRPLLALRDVVQIGHGEAVPGRRVVRFDELIERSEPVRDAGLGGDDLAGIYYTAGTTARSKGVMLTQGNVLSNAINAAISMQFDEDSIYLHSAPMFHLADGTSTFAVTMVGGCHSFVPRFDAAECLATIEQERVTNAQFVPTMIKMLLEHPDVTTRDLSSLGMILYGANPINDETLRRAMRYLPECGFVHGYGMTEVASIATMLPAKYCTMEQPHARRRRSCGKPAVLTDVKVAGPDGATLPPFEIGEILIRGPNVMRGYWNQPEATAQVLRDGWMHSGDLGYFDEAGFLYLTDRKKDMIKSGGENVFAVEVENVIAEIESILECAVIGIPHDLWGETVHAIVVPRPGATLDEQQVIAFCREHLARFKCPTSVTIRHERLPLSAAGKILKRDLRAPYWQR